MIDLTPLDIRQKRGDFRRAMRGYEPSEVDSFLELVAERMEQLVRENLKYREEWGSLEQELTQARDRERAVQEALVTATELSRDVTGQAQREADLLRREAESEVERLLVEAEGRLDQVRLSVAELDRRRRRYLKTYRTLLEQELDVVAAEEQIDPLEGMSLDLEGFGSFAPVPTTTPPAPAPSVSMSQPAPGGDAAAAPPSAAPATPDREPPESATTAPAAPEPAAPATREPVAPLPAVPEPEPAPAQPARDVPTTSHTSPGAPAPEPRPETTPPTSPTSGGEGGTGSGDPKYRVSLGGEHRTEDGEGPGTDG